MTSILFILFIIIVVFVIFVSRGGKSARGQIPSKRVQFENVDLYSVANPHNYGVMSDYKTGSGIGHSAQSRKPQNTHNVHNTHSVHNTHNIHIMPVPQLIPPSIHFSDIVTERVYDPRSGKLIGNDHTIFVNDYGKK